MKTSAAKTGSVSLPVTYADVAAAAEKLTGAAHRTPALTSRTVDERTGAKVFFKCENFQRMGAFKFRGAVIGVEPAAGDDVTRSFQTKTLQTVHNPDTIAGGALAAAALLEGKLAARGRRVGIIISGGNVDLKSLARWV